MGSGSWWLHHNPISRVVLSPRQLRNDREGTRRRLSRRPRPLRRRCAGCGRWPALGESLRNEKVGDSGSGAHGAGATWKNPSHHPAIAITATRATARAPSWTAHRLGPGLPGVAPWRRYRHAPQARSRPNRTGPPATANSQSPAGVDASSIPSLASSGRSAVKRPSARRVPNLREHAVEAKARPGRRGENPPPASSRNHRLASTRSASSWRRQCSVREGGSRRDRR